MCHEEDRKAKPAEEGQEAIDPDLPTRRHATACLCSMLVAVDPDASLRVLGGEWPGVVGTPFALLQNSDAGIRTRAASLLCELLGADGAGKLSGAATPAPTAEQCRKRAELVVEFATKDPEKVALAVAKGLADEDEAVSGPSGAVLRALQASTAAAALKDELVKAGAVPGAA